MDCSSHLNVLQDGGLMWREGSRNETEENPSSNPWSKMLQLLRLWLVQKEGRVPPSWTCWHYSLLKRTSQHEILMKTVGQKTEFIAVFRKADQEPTTVQGQQRNSGKFRQWRWRVEIDGKKKWERAGWESGQRGNGVTAEPSRKWKEK